MNKDIEELRFVADLAHNGGMMQAQNEHLKLESERQRAENERLREELESLKAMRQQVQGQPTVVVNNYYLLSMPKTNNYVRTLDNNGRRFVGHFMHHTLSDGTPLSVIAQVDRITQLEPSQDERLAEAMEELARKPTTQNNYGDYVSGDKVGEKAVVPHVENYRPEIQMQSNTFAAPHAAGHDNELTEE